MTNKTLAVLLVGLPTLYYCIQYAGSNGALIERFPDHNRKVVTKIHRQILKEVLLGMHKDAESDEDYDKIYYAKFAELNR